MTDKEKTARRLRGLRAESKMTQMEVAKAIGVSEMTISNYERGATSPDIISAKRLATLFGVTLDELVGRAPEEVA